MGTCGSRSRPTPARSAASRPPVSSPSTAPDSARTARPTDITAGPTASSGSRRTLIPAASAASRPTAPSPSSATGSQPTRGRAASPRGSDDSLWFTESASPGAIGRITATGLITEHTLGLTPGSAPWYITPGPDGNMWFTGNANPGLVARITVPPAVKTQPAQFVDVHVGGLPREDPSECAGHDLLLRVRTERRSSERSVGQLVSGKQLGYASTFPGASPISQSGRPTTTAPWPRTAPARPSASSGRSRRRALPRATAAQMPWTRSLISQRASWLPQGRDDPLPPARRPLAARSSHGESRSRSEQRSTRAVAASR